MTPASVSAISLPPSLYDTPFNLFVFQSFLLPLFTLRYGTPLMQEPSISSASLQKPLLHSGSVAVPLPFGQLLQSSPFCAPQSDNKGVGNAFLDSPASKLPTQPLPRYLFVAGVEGSGHHALLDVWRHLEENGTPMCIIVYDQLFHSFGIENHASYHYSSIRLSQHMEQMNTTIHRARVEEKHIVIDAQNSYPMGTEAGSMAHPDLVNMAALHDVLYDLRVVVLVRDPVDAVLSAVRRFGTQPDDTKNKGSTGGGEQVPRYRTAVYQARAISESLVQINNALALLPCGQTVIVRLEDLLRDPERYAEPFSQLLDVEVERVRVALSTALKKDALHAHGAETGEERRIRRELNDFFALHADMWPLLNTQPVQIINSDPSSF